MNIFILLAIISLSITILSTILSLCFRNNEKALFVFIILILGSMMLSWVFLSIFAWIIQAYLHLIAAILGCISVGCLIISFIKVVI